MKAAALTWRRLDQPGGDTCALMRAPGGWVLDGTAWFAETRLTYRVECSEDWSTKRATVTGQVDGRDVAWEITRAPVWQINGTPVDGLEVARDIDLSFTPATNLMPLRRLPESGAMQVQAAWFLWPDATLQPLDQSYQRLDGGQVQYRSQQTGFEATLTVNSAGFVTEYPGLWAESRDA